MLYFWYFSSVVTLFIALSRPQGKHRAAERSRTELRQQQHQFLLLLYFENKKTYVKGQRVYIKILMKHHQHVVWLFFFVVQTAGLL